MKRLRDDSVAVSKMRLLTQVQKLNLAFNHARRSPLLSLIATVWLVGVIGLLVAPQARPEVDVTHWANGHLIDSRELLPDFAKTFNESNAETASSKPIRVKLFKANSGQITGELYQRVRNGIAVDRTKPDPTIVTPAAEHWVSDVNETVGQQVLERSNVLALATTYVGVVTSREMAQCLGWPQREIGFADIVSLTTDPQGWGRYDCARPEWGREALVAFTFPSRSSTARSVLYALYSIMAGKAPEQLTVADVAKTEVAEPLHRFQATIDCLVADTLELNIKIVTGAPCAHFYFLAEDNLVQLYQGKVESPSGAVAHLERDMVMIYPKEGSIVHNHSAFIVNASFVSSDQAEAARRWIAFLRADNQQQTLMQAGFRPAASAICVPPLGSPFSQCAVTPRVLIYPDRIKPEVAAAILKAWN